MFVVSGVSRGVAYFYVCNSAPICPFISSDTNEDRLEKINVDALQRLNLSDGVRLAYSLSLSSIGYGNFMFVGNPNKVKRLSNSLLVAGVNSVESYLFGNKLTYLGTTYEGQNIYSVSNETPMVCWIDGVFYVTSNSDNTLDEINNILNDNISASLQSSLFVIDAPAVAKAALKPVNANFIFGKLSQISKLAYLDKMWQDKADNGLCKDVSNIPAVLNLAISCGSLISAAYASNLKPLDLGYDINYYDTVNGVKIFKPTFEGVSFPDAQFGYKRYRVDGEEYQADAVVRASLLKARREVIELQYEAFKLQPKIDLAANNYGDAKFNLALGEAAAAVIMRQFYAILEMPVVCSYNNQIISLVGEVGSLDDNANFIIDKNHFKSLFNLRSQSAGYYQSSCGRTYIGLKSCNVYNADFTTEEVAIAPNYAANMKITQTVKEFVLADRQIYKPWFGKERVVVERTSVNRPAMAIEALLQSIETYCNNLLESVRAILKLNKASSAIIFDSLASYSSLISSRSALISRADNMRHVIESQSKGVLFKDMKGVHITNESCEMPFVVYEKLYPELVKLEVEFPDPPKPPLPEPSPSARGGEDDDTPNEPSGPLEVTQELTLDWGKFTLLCRREETFDEILVKSFELSEEISIPDDIKRHIKVGYSENLNRLLKFYYGVEGPIITSAIDLVEAVGSSKNILLETNVATASAYSALLARRWS